MNDALRWLLRLDTLNFGQSGVEFGFERPLPMWGWALAALASVWLGWMAYRKLEGSRAVRISLGALRALVIILIALLIAGPRLIRPNEVEEPDWVLVLADRSASMTVKDVAASPGSPPPAARLSRDGQLRAALEASRGVWSALAADRVVVWLGFDTGAYEIKPADAAAAPGTVPDLGPPVGRRTDLNRALDAALKRAGARPLSGVVVFSDGRSIDEPSRALLRRLEAEKVPVFTVALGSDRGVADLAVRRAEAPRAAFINDAVPIEVEVERIGGAETQPGSAAPRATVELVDSATGAILDSQESVFDPAPEEPAVEGSSASAPAVDARKQKLTLLTRPSSAGNQNWTVRIRPSVSSATDAITEDLVDDNNRAEIPIELVDRPLRVLYLDGYPRWEYRYLKNILIRESSIASSVTIFAPGRRYLQEGTDTLDAIPNSPEEWGRFDVLILGDVDPRVFTSEQLNQVRDRVATAGLGLIFIAGEGAVPALWRGTPLADLLPFTASADSAGSGDGIGPDDAAPAWGEPVTLHPEPAADALGLLRLSEKPVDGSWWPQRLSDPATGWSQLRWAQRIDPRSLKPTAEVLATARPALGAAIERAPAAAPLILSMRFGAGRSVYVGTDEIWRWRYGRGEYYTERFWLQMVRLLGRESVARSGKPAILRVLPDRAQTDQPIRIEVTLLDQSLVQTRPSSLRVRLRRDDAANLENDGAIELALSPEGQNAADLSRPAPRTFISTWIPTQSGRYRVEAVDPLLISSAAGASALSATVEVWQPDDELRQPQTNHALLTALSRATGGETLSAADLSALPRLLPNRRLKLAGEPDVQTLWDTPLALIVLVTLLTAEWIGRRLLRLA